jgi:hypothetical protein
MQVPDRLYACLQLGDRQVACLQSNLKGMCIQPDKPPAAQNPERRNEEGKLAMPLRWYHCLIRTCNACLA